MSHLPKAARYKHLHRLAWLAVALALAVFATALILTFRRPRR